MKIGVIGGGVAGLCAALEARDRGAKVILFEALPHLGGRVAGGPKFDTGRHLVSNAYTSFLRLTDRLGSTGAIQFRPLVLGAQVGRHMGWWHLQGPLLSGSAGTALGLLLSRLLPLAARPQALTALARTLAAPAAEPDDDTLLGDGNTRFLTPSNETVETLFRKTGWPGPLISRVGDPLALGMFNAPAREADAAAFVNALRRIVTTPEPQAGWSRSNVGEVLTEPAGRVLPEAGVDLRLGTRVKQVKRGDKGGWDISTANEATHVEAVVVTVPFNHVGFLMETPEAAELVDQAGRTEGRAIMTLRARFADMEALPGPLAEQDDDLAIWFAESHPEGGVLVERVVSGLPSDVPPDLQALSADLLARAKRLLGCSEVLASEVRYYPRSTPLLGPATPRPTIRQGPGLYYAGDWSATGLPATLESAARAGWLAGQAAVEDERWAGTRAMTDH